MPAINKNLHPDAVIHATIYARVSREEEEDDKGFTLPQQIKACVEYARMYGFTVNEAHIFQDDMTGKIASRPGIDALHRVAAAGLIQAVIVYKMSRLGRTHYHQVCFMREMKQYGVEIYDTSTAPGKPSPERTLLQNMLSMIAEYEHAIILDRMEQGRRERAYQGYPRKQRVPFGYRYIELTQEDGRCFQSARSGRHTKGYYEIVPEEAAIVRQIYLWYVHEGWATYRIAQELDRLGVPSALSALFLEVQR
jgi:site-specific DNA recombinase